MNVGQLELPPELQALKGEGENENGVEFLKTQAVFVFVVVFTITSNPVYIINFQKFTSVLTPPLLISAPRAPSLTLGSSL